MDEEEDDDRHADRGAAQDERGLGPALPQEAEGDEQLKGHGSPPAPVPAAVAPGRPA